MPSFSRVSRELDSLPREAHYIPPRVLTSFTIARLSSRRQLHASGPPGLYDRFGLTIFAIIHFINAMLLLCPYF